MKPILKFLQIFLLGTLILGLSSSAYSQRAAAELITSLPTPDFKENVLVKDGERFVLFHNNYLFTVNFWVGIQVWDVSNIEKPRKVSFLPTNDQVHHIAIHENRLYAANKTEGIIIFDISNLERPYEMARIKTPGDAYWVDIHYPYLYIAMGGDGFCIIDISNLSDPRTLTLEIPETWIWSLKYENEKLYVAAKQGGLVIYDATNPTSLLKITQYKTGNHCLQFQIEDSLMYIADGPGGLLILDISAPRLPKQIGRFTTTGFTQHIFKSGNYAYLSNLELGLLIVKVNQPQNPQLEVRYITESQTYSSFKHDVYVFLSTDTKTEILRHNNQPVLEPIADQIIDENFQYVLPLKAQDPDGDQIYFEAKNLPPGSLFDGKSGVFSWTPNFEQSGIYSGTIFTVIERTASRLSDSDTVTFKVKHVNRLPELPDIANREIPEDSTLTIQVPEGSDLDKEDAGKLKYRVENIPDGVAFDSLKRVFSWKPAFDQSGVYIVDFVLDDRAGGIDREAVTLTVTHVDRPPKIDAIADAVVNEANPLSIKLSGEELDKEDLDKISFTIFNLPTGAAFDPATRQFNWTPTYDQSGLYSRVNAVMKAGKLSDTTFFNITVNHVNRPPVLVAITDQVAEENKKLRLVISGSDPDKEDAGKLVYAALNLPSGANFKSDSLVLSWLPTFEQSGGYSGIEFNVKDPEGLMDQKTVAITVNHVNRPPVLADVPPLNSDENMPLQQQLMGSDPDAEDLGKLVYSATGLPQGATLDASSGLFSWTPTFEQSGQYPITFSINDGLLKDNKQTTITINHINQRPVLADIPSQTVNENIPLSFVISGSDPDKEDEGKLVFSVQNLPAGAVFNPSSRTFSWTPSFDQSGNYGSVMFQVADPAGLISEKTASVIVIQVNRPPQLAAVPATSGNEQEALSFTLSATDQDKEDDGKLHYQISNLPTGAVLDAAAGEFNWTPTYEQSGEFNLNAEVIDSAGATSQTKISLSIKNINRPPVIEPVPALTGKENEPLTVNLKFSDPDKEDQGKLQVSSGGLPTGANLNAAKGAITWTPTYNQSGGYTIDYTITDGFGATASGTLSVQVENVNRAPEIKEVGSKNVQEGQEVSFRVDTSDPDEEDQGKVALSADGMPAGANFNGSSGAFNWVPREDQQGDYQITISAKDPQGASAQITVRITVEDVPAPTPQ